MNPRWPVPPGSTLLTPCAWRPGLPAPSRGIRHSAPKGTRRCRALPLHSLHMVRSPTRLHERMRFFKYMPAGTARKVLTSRTLRWSSPIAFNDPFDTPRELAHGVSPLELSRAVGLRMAAWITSPRVDTSSLGPKARLIVNLARQAIPAEARGEIISTLTSGTELETPLSSLDELRDLWRTFVPNFRMLCLTEDPSSASMWTHYADGLSGAVLELKCIDELDSPWLAARPVSYLTRADEMFSAGELAEIILMPHRQACEAILNLATFRKSPEWSNEREWRVVSSKRPTDVGDYSDYSFDAAEVSAVYLGPRISSEDRADLVGLCRSMPPRRVFQVEIAAGQAFQFRELSLLSV
jgi:hypothetical protein